jgi:hypothetical protein
MEQTEPMALMAILEQLDLLDHLVLMAQMETTELLAHKAFKV